VTALPFVHRIPFQGYTKMKAILAGSLLVIGVTGCAWQSDPQKVAENTYQVSANASPARGAATGARQMALTAANKKCDSLGKNIEITNTETGWAFPTNSVVTVTFRCD
jgi:hypothetical protein